MPKKPQILDVTTVARSRLFHIEQVDLRFANGAEACFERLQSHSRGAVLVIPVDGDDLVLIREYAVGTERYELGFPKGSIDAGEQPTETALRELREEIGMGARDIRLLRRIVMSPAYFNHVTYIITAHDLYPDPLPGDEPEPLIVHRWPIARMRELLEHAEFGDGRNQLALYLFADTLSQAKA
jgi:ADP-ribose diphosphatase